jgi:hypothetical protein
MADAASETATIRLEMDNAQLQPAGSRYKVVVPEAAPLGASQPPGALPFASSQQTTLDRDDRATSSDSARGLARSQVTS